MSTADGTRPTDDELTVHNRLRVHARAAMDHADDLLAAGDPVMAAAWLIDAADLLRLAAHQLDREVCPVTPAT